MSEGALSPGLRDLDHAWALAELVRSRVERGIAEIRRSGAAGLRVENQLKPRSLFTVPLSLHRELDRVAVCLSPDELDEFEPCWTLPGRFVHEPAWRVHEPGEADQAARTALSLLGGYPGPRRIGRREPPVEEMIRRWAWGSD